MSFIPCTCTDLTLSLRVLDDRAEGVALCVKADTFGKNSLTRQKNISCSVNSREEKES